MGVVSQARTFAAGLCLFASVLGGALARPALADAGELLVDVDARAQVSFLTHPAVAAGPETSPFSSASTWALVPQAGVAVRYGVLNTLHVGVGLEGGGSTGLVSRGVSVGSATGDLYTATHLAFALPASIGFRFDTGFPQSGVLELAVGPALTYFGASALADPHDLDAAGLPARIPIEIADRVQLGGLVRVNALFEARLFDGFLLAMGPSAGVSWAGTPAVHVGLLVRPSFVLPRGP